MVKNGLFYLSRTVEFSASHRLFLKGLSESENHALFGACANPHGHGHNYLLEVTVCGPQNPQTGLVLHFDVLKAILHEEVVVPLDHRHLNFDVPFLLGMLPSSENLVKVLWERIEGALERASKPNGVRLFKVTLASTARNRVEYYGPDGFLGRP